MSKHGRARLRLALAVHESCALRPMELARLDGREIVPSRLLPQPRAGRLRLAGAPALGRGRRRSMMQVHSMALAIVEELAPMMPLIQRQDRALAIQLRTAANSMVLNIAESEYSDPGNRRARLFSAAGSANESRSAVRGAIALGYVPREPAPQAPHPPPHLPSILSKPPPR